MILFFGPAGSGKSLQGQLLAARHSWEWLSTGNMLRCSKNEEVVTCLREGNLVSNELTNKVVEEALADNQEAGNLVLDGYPRNTEQAQWLINRQESGDLKVDLAIVFEVPRQELVRRLDRRGRGDDTPEAIDIRLGIYRKEIYPILSFLSGEDVPIVHINGVGTVGEVHDTVNAELESRGLTD